jgi:hypothetical protein
VPARRIAAIGRRLAQEGASEHTPRSCSGVPCCAFAPITQHFAKPADVRPKITFIDHHIRPRARDKLFLANNLPCAFDQRNQDVQRAAANVEWHLISEENRYHSIRCWHGKPIPPYYVQETIAEGNRASIAFPLHCTSEPFL